MQGRRHRPERAPGPGGAVDSRTTSRGRMSRERPATGAESILARSCWNVSAAISGSGWRTVVSGGSNRSASRMSSKPTTETSCPALRPASFAPRQIPIAHMSLMATKAVGGRGPDSSSRAALRPSSAASLSLNSVVSAPGQTTASAGSSPADSRAARKPRSRSRRLTLLTDPETNASRRWPSSMR